MFENWIIDFYDLAFFAIVVIERFKSIRKTAALHEKKENLYKFFFFLKIFCWVDYSGEKKELSTDNWDMMLFDIFTTSVDIYKKNCSLNHLVIVVT